MCLGGRSGVDFTSTTVFSLSPIISFKLSPRSSTTSGATPEASWLPLLMLMCSRTDLIYGVLGLRFDRTCASDPPR